MIKSYKDLDVYNLSFSLAMEIFQLSKDFPKEETYSLTSQLIRSSRSISSNIVEGWPKRIDEKKFKLRLVDALGSTAETQNWLQFAKACHYKDEGKLESSLQKLDQIGRMLTKLHQNWKTQSIQPQTSNL